MSTFLLLAALVIAVIDWVAVWYHLRQIEYVAKPGVMISLLAWVGCKNGFHGLMVYFALGLLFSLLGDIFLMLPSSKFLAGLVAFLLGHLCYIAGFNPDGGLFSGPAFLLAVVIFIAIVEIYPRIAEGCRRKKKNYLIAPIFFYVVALAMMVLSALTTLFLTNWRLGEAALVSIGALLFMISDSLLAWNRYVETLPRGPIYVIVAYHIGQMLITLGAGLHFLA